MRKQRIVINIKQNILLKQNYVVELVNGNRLNANTIIRVSFNFISNSVATCNLILLFFKWNAYKSESVSSITFCQILPVLIFSCRHILYNICSTGSALWMEKSSLLMGVLPHSKVDYWSSNNIQYIPRSMHTVFALLCFVVVIHWLIFPYPPGLLHWHCGNLTIAPVPAKQPWLIWINTSCEFIINDCITTTKQSTTKPCAYLFGYTVDCPAKIHRGWNLAKSVFPIDSCSVTEYWKNAKCGSMIAVYKVS